MLVGIVGNALAQSSADNHSQNNSRQASQQGSKTPGVEPSSVRKRSKGYLGVYLGDVNSERARELGLSDLRGAVVGKVEEGSPGQKAGLKVNDVILSYNGQAVQNRTHFHRLLESAIPGSKVTLEISRDGKKQNLLVTLGEGYRAATDERERLFGEVTASLMLAEEIHKQAEELKLKGDEKGAAEKFEEERKIRKDAAERQAYTEKELREGNIQPLSRPETVPSPARYNLGLSTIELGEQLAKFFNLNGPGVLVAEVQAGGLAERAGIKAGDCIVMINGIRVNSSNDLTRIRSGNDNKDPVEIIVTIVRDRVEQIVKIKLDSR